MGRTLIEKILGAHAGRDVTPGEIVDITIDARVARDFGGANVVKNLRENGLGIDAVVAIEVRQVAGLSEMLDPERLHALTANRAKPFQAARVAV